MRKQIKELGIRLLVGVGVVAVVVIPAYLLHESGPIFGRMFTWKIERQDQPEYVIHDPDGQAGVVFYKVCYDNGDYTHVGVRSNRDLQRLPKGDCLERFSSSKGVVVQLVDYRIYMASGRYKPVR